MMKLKQKAKIQLLLLRCGYISGGGKKKSNKIQLLFWRSYNSLMCIFSSSHKAAVNNVMRELLEMYSKKKHRSKPHPNNHHHTKRKNR